MIKSKYQKKMYKQGKFKKNTIIEAEVTVADQTISYVLTNATSEKPVIFCLPGLYETKEHLIPFAQAMGSDYRMLIIDWIGHGKSTNDETYWTLEGQVSFLEQLLTILKATYPITTLLGQSWGATLLLMHTNLHAEMTLILGNLTHLRSEKTEKMYTQMIENGQSSPYSLATTTDFDQLMYLYFSNPEQLKVYDWQGWGQQALVQSSYIGPALEQWHAEFSLFFAESFLAHHQAQKVLLLWGGEDPLYDVRKGYVVKWTIPHSHIEILPHASQLPVSEQPEKAAKIVKKFLQKQEELSDEH
ncbi:MAG: alpha/beta fold hydrolase [Culicoidibacterales bacterium]